MRRVTLMPINGRTQNKNKKRTLFGVIIVGVIVITGISILLPDNQGMLKQPVLITDDNRHLIGKETIEFSQDKLLKQTQTSIPTNRMIKQINEENFIPSSIVEFKTKEENGVFISPEIITINGSISVLTNPNGGGWYLKAGDKIGYAFQKYESEVIANQKLLIGFIKDGVLNKGQEFNQLKGDYTLTIEESGEYHVFLLNASSDTIALKDGYLNIPKDN
jgi:hypothetical protein